MIIHWTEEEKGTSDFEQQVRAWLHSLWCGVATENLVQKDTHLHFHREHGFFNDGKKGFGGTLFSDNHIFYAIIF